MKRVMMCATLLVALAACNASPPKPVPDSAVVQVATAPDGTKLWGVPVEDRVVFFSSAGTQTSHSEGCGKGCTRTVDDPVPAAR